MEWGLLPLKRYAEFSGRSRRKEYWMFSLLLLIAYIVLAVIAAILGGMGSLVGGDVGGAILGGPVWLLIGLLGLAVFIPALAVQVRRFHDQDKSGWLVLLNFVPFVGALIVLVFMCLEGTRGRNRYGDDPKASVISGF